MVTVSPASNPRTVASPVGKVTSWWATLRVPVQEDVAAGRDVRCRPPGGPALVVHGDGVQGDVGVGLLDVHREHGRVAAEPHRADAGRVQEVVKLVLEGGNNTREREHLDVA